MRKSFQALRVLVGHDGSVMRTMLSPIFNAPDYRETSKLWSSLLVMRRWLLLLRVTGSSSRRFVGERVRSIVNTRTGKRRKRYRRRGKSLENAALQLAVYFPSWKVRSEVTTGRPCRPIDPRSGAMERGSRGCWHTRAFSSRSLHPRQCFARGPE